MIHFLFSMKTQKAPAHRVQGLWNSFLLAVCQQVLDLLQGVDDAGNGHIVVQCHHKVGSILGNIHVHIPVAGQQLGHTVGQVGAHNVGQGAVFFKSVPVKIAYPMHKSYYHRFTAIKFAKPS